MKERVSALLDGGTLDQGASRQLMDALSKDGELRSKWDTYCLIGDALRNEQDTLPLDFCAKVMARLGDEPTVVAPVPVTRPGGQGWARKLVPLAASVMGVAAVGWVALNINGMRANAQPAQLAGAPAQAAQLASAVPASAAAVSSGPSSGEAPASEREYVFAHQALSPASPIPGVALYVRTVSDNLPNGSR